MAVTKLDIDPIKAWDYTPFEIGLICERVAESNKTKVEHLIYLAWHTEAFARQKRLPSLEKAISGIRKTKNSNRSDEILKAMAREKGVIIH